jgi:undecaprenyl-diphosphatase
MWEYLLRIDRNLFLYLNGLGAENWDYFWLLLSKRGANVVLYLLILFFYGKKHGYKSALILFFTAVLLVVLTDQGTNVFKNSFQRLRPCNNPELDGIMRHIEGYCGGGYSFFSGHSSNSFALAVLFSTVFRFVKWVPLFLFTVASFIAYSRVYLGVHFPLDILCGSIFGVFTGYTFSILLERFLSEKVGKY